jgi:Ethanolamine utilization protein EutJ (predicted chaperonin)
MLAWISLVRGFPQVIDGLGPISQIVRRNPDFDPRRQLGFGPRHYEIWNRIGSDTSLAELLTKSAGPEEASVALLRQLRLWRALILQLPGTVDDLQIDDQVDIGAVTPEEARLLAEPVDLQEWEKRRIVAVLRTLRRGKIFELLGVQPGSSKLDLKRAYYRLSKEFHPDRYYGKNLGSFAGLLSLIFETAAVAMKTLSDPRTVTEPVEQSPAGRRRRRHTRFQLALRVRVQLESWTRSRELVTEEVSEGGMFVGLSGGVDLRQRVRAAIFLSDSEVLALTGIVVSTSARGFGVAFDAIGAEEKPRFEQLMNAAREAVPLPGDTIEGSNRRPVLGSRLARGTAPHEIPSPAIVGIDLGTTYTSVAALMHGRVSVLPWGNGAKAIPSVVHFPEPGRHIIGAAARERMLTDPKHTVASAKRLLGRSATDRDLEGHLAQSSFDTTVGPDGSIVVQMYGEPYAIVQIYSYLLAAARDAAEAAMGRRVEQAVVTVPVCFTEDRVELVRRAGKLAHVEVIDVVDEPTAAALANRFDPEFGGLIGVYDFGGGTFDFSVVDARGGDFRVLATAGDSWLGGDDFDMAVAEAIANRFWQVHGMDLRSRLVEWQYLLFGCERAKRELSTRAESHIIVPELLRTELGVQDLDVRVTREAVERLWGPVIDRSLATCTQAMGLLGMRPSDLTAIYVSGGTSYIPAVRRALEQRFQTPVRTGVLPEFAVCLGAGLLAADRATREAIKHTNQKATPSSRA